MFSVFATETACSKGVQHDVPQFFSHSPAVVQPLQATAPSAAAAVRGGSIPVDAGEPRPSKRPCRVQTSALLSDSLPSSHQHDSAVEVDGFHDHASSDVSDPEYDTGLLTPCSGSWSCDQDDCSNLGAVGAQVCDIGPPPPLHMAWSVDDGFALPALPSLVQTPLLGGESPHGSRTPCFSFGE